MTQLKLYNVPFFLKWLFPFRTWTIQSDQAVFFTFDDGPHPEITPWLLDLAQEKKAKFTFFWLGKNMLNYPELVDRALKEGHTIGNHGMEHLNAYKVKHKKYIENVKEGSAIAPHNLFRPPYGRLSWRKSWLLKNETNVVMWSWLSYDWLVSSAPSQIINKCKKHIRPGKVLVFHESEKTKDKIKEIIPPLLNFVLEKGWNAESINKP